MLIGSDVVVLLLPMLGEKQRYKNEKKNVTLTFCIRFELTDWG